MAYFIRQAILKRFVNDKGYYGLENSIKRLANKSLSLESFQNDYDFFKWKVVYVVNLYPFCFTEERWKVKCSPRYVDWINPESVYCSAKNVYTDFPYQKIHSIIAWCHKEVKEDYNSERILDNYDLGHDRDEIKNYVKNQGKKINFVITVVKGGFF